MKKGNYYLGLDIGTDSVGYAVTDEEYNLLKHHGKPVWGVTVFDEASLNAERRKFRTARRRLDRRQQRVELLQELFAEEIGKVDEGFFKRLRESALFRDEAGDRYPLFNDKDFTDKDYYAKYPTIHHLICDLMMSEETHDVRLVYLACAWLVAHRGHFLSNIDEGNIAEIKDFSSIYTEFYDYFIQNSYVYPWKQVDADELGRVLQKKIGVTAKEKALTALFIGSGKAPKVGSEDFPFSQAAVIKLLAGGTCKLKDLFQEHDEYDAYGGISLTMNDEKLEEIAANIKDDFDLISVMRKMHDWCLLNETLGDKGTISEAKVNIYEQHKKDLSFLKKLIRKYCSGKYDEIFRIINTENANYAAYVYHTDGDEQKLLKKKSKEDFAKYILDIVKDITPEEKDRESYEDMCKRLELRRFMPKQKDTDNRVIPYQLYLYELRMILRKAETYLGFLSKCDEEGLSTSEKIISVFCFRVPYYVGPLNTSSEKAWLVRKAGKIYPWNFENMVDLDASEEAFIKKLTGKCTYLPGEPVLPKDSLLYHKFTVLNEINNLRINGIRIPVDLKQRIYSELFLSKKKITRKKLIEFLLSEGIIAKGEEDTVSGIDNEIKTDLAPQIAFRNLLNAGVLNEEDAERIIERASYAEDKSRLSKWLIREYPGLKEEDRKYLCSQKWKDFGRLSRKFLTGLEGADSTGEIYTIIGALWNTQNNLMELLSDQYTFMSEVEAFRKDYYAEHTYNLSDRMDDMYLSNPVKRSVYRTLDIVKDVSKAFGNPVKIFVEMTRGATEGQKGKRTKTRREQILELYKKCKDEDVRELKKQLEDMGSSADTRLQGDKLFLYYMQLGKCMYSGQPIDLVNLGTNLYNIDHIYPQSYVKDDSILNNKVLVLSEVNGTKDDIYPVADDIRHRMHGFWDYLKGIGLLNEEKHRRLTRATPFTDEEKYGFINRQLTETSQSVKAVATLLKEKYADAEIVYCKSRLTTEFRQEFDLYKSRSFNDLHHAVDAYLNIVTGNVYNMKFTKNFNVHSEYSIKTKTVFTHPVVSHGKTVWDGKNMLARVKATAVKNTAHFTKYAYFKKGGFFDQMPVSAAEGLIPRKKGLSTEKYGGYNKAGVMFFIPVKYQIGKKTELFILPVELLQGNRFLEDSKFAYSYSCERLGRILNKTIDSVSFPMGMRPWKINSVLSLDGFRVCISGTGNGGRGLVAQSIMQFSADGFWQFYLKKLEMLVEKTGKNPNYIFDEQYDKVTTEKNLELYKLYCEKLQHSIFNKRINSPVELLLKGRKVFQKLSVCEQAKALLNIHQVFRRVAGGCDLRAIGGKQSTASTNNLSTTVSNWKKKYTDVRLIDTSVSGLWEKESENILNLI